MPARLLDPLLLGSELLEQWELFRAANPLYASPFYSHAFAKAVASARNDAKVAVLESAGKVIGFLPLHLTRGGGAKPIGGPINDYHGPILAPEIAMSPEQLVRAAGISAYDYNHLPCGLGALALGCRRRSTSPQMDLSKGYGACVARKDLSWSRAASLMRRRWRQTEAEFGPIRFTFHDPSDATYLRHVEFKDAHYRELGISGSVSKGWTGKVLESIRRAQEPDFAGVMSTIHAGERLLATHFGMRSQSVWHWWFPAYDPELAKLSPGITLVNECAKSAQEHGIKVIDFGRGTERYKLQFADRAVELCEGSMTREGSLAAVIRRLADGAVGLAERLPLGRFETYPSRAAARMVSGVNLPGGG